MPEEGFTHTTTDLLNAPPVTAALSGWEETTMLVNDVELEVERAGQTIGPLAAGAIARVGQRPALPGCPL